MTARALVRLARASNLPTVLSNVLCGVTLAGAAPTPGALLRLGAGMSALYTGGMFLNDAFDQGWDAVHRPERPIPRGEVELLDVLGLGAALLALGVWLIGRKGHGLVSALVLCALIVAYDLWHKTSPAAPLVMAGCRLLVYIGAGLGAGGHLTGALVAGGGALFVYVAGLTAWSRFGGLYVAQLVAGISLLDALVLLLCGQPARAAAAAACFMLTLRLQRRVPGS